MFRFRGNDIVLFGVREPDNYLVNPFVEHTRSINLTGIWRILLVMDTAAEAYCK